MKRKGFTLIELLVVIAIIAILAAILFPIFAGAKERARQAKCLNNLKQLMIGIQQYVDDNDGLMPLCGNAASNADTVPQARNDWAGSQYHCQAEPRYGSIFKYTKSEAVYLCPTDIGVKAADIMTPVKYPANYKISYSMNGDIASLYSAPSSYRPAAMNLAVETAGRASKVMVLIHEQRGWEQKKPNPYDGGYLGINDGYFSYRGSIADLPSGIHYDGTACVYADGHAKWISYKQLLLESDIAHASAGCPNSMWLPNSIIDKWARKNGRTVP